MGRSSAEGFKEMIDQGLTNLDNALIWHLQSNHYPPVPLCMLDTCKKAIELANQGEWNTMVNLPDGVTFCGDTAAPVSNIIESHHLDTFLDQEDQDYDLDNTILDDDDEYLECQDHEDQED